MEWKIYMDKTVDCAWMCLSLCVCVRTFCLCLWKCIHAELTKRPNDKRIVNVNIYITLFIIYRNDQFRLRFAPISFRFSFFISLAHFVCRSKTFSLFSPSVRKWINRDKAISIFLVFQKLTRQLNKMIWAVVFRLFSFLFPCRCHGLMRWKLMSQTIKMVHQNKPIKFHR